MSASNFNAPLPTAQLRLNVPVVSPNGTSVVVGTSSVAAIGYNQNRRGIIFINPSATVTLYVCPANQVAVAGQGVPILPQGQQTFISDPNTNVSFNCGWNAIAQSGGSNSLTVLELL